MANVHVGQRRFEIDFSWIVDAGWYEAELVSVGASSFHEGREGTSEAVL